jgi:hypothetical protein
MEFFISQVIGFLVGILSSWLFWYALLLAKPKIVISKNIVINRKKGSLLVKVINRGRRQATDIQASLALVERYNTQCSTQKRPSSSISSCSRISQTLGSSDSFCICN